MTRSIPEHDWNYLQSIEAELRSRLCKRINQRSMEILRSECGSEHEKYVELYKHIAASERVIDHCFGDWRRSNLWFVLPHLRRHNLLTDEHITNLSDASRVLIGKFFKPDKE